MRNHKGLELEEMIWWLSKDGQKFSLNNENDGQYTASCTQADGTATTGQAGTSLAAVGIVFDGVYGEEEDKSTIRNLFSKFTGGLINNCMAEAAEGELEHASE